MANIGLRTTGPRLMPGNKPLISKIYYSSLFALNSKHAKLHDWVDYGTVFAQEKKITIKITWIFSRPLNSTRPLSWTLWSRPSSWITSTTAFRRTSLLWSPIQVLKIREGCKTGRDWLACRPFKQNYDTKWTPKNVDRGRVQITQKPN